GGIVVGAGDQAALRQDHRALVREGDIGNRQRARLRRNVELPARIGGEAAVARDTDRPDLRSGRDGIIESALLHREAPNPARGRSETPGVRLLAIEAWAGDVEPVLRIKRHGCELGRAKARDAVIVAAEFVAVEIEAMDHAGVEVRHEQLLVRGIVGEIAQARARIRDAVEGHVVEQRHRAGAAIDLVDGAGTALQVESELPLHPADAGTAFFPAHRQAVASATDDVEAERRGGSDIDVGWGLIVERDAENLADIFGEHIEYL